jgi:aminoglycoside phosphotransferase (APT) family kinase protein
VSKRASLFSVPTMKAEPEALEPAAAAASPAPVPVAVTEPEAQARKYPVAKTREGRRAATVYLDKEALRQLQKIAFDEETTIQVLLAEGVNGVFAARGLSRIA